MIQNKKELVKYFNSKNTISNKYPVTISKFINNAKEVEVDAVADNGKLIICAIRRSFYISHFVKTPSLISKALCLFSYNTLILHKA